jgi:hypothetical protein
MDSRHETDQPPTPTTAAPDRPTQYLEVQRDLLVATRRLVSVLKQRLPLFSAPPLFGMAIIIAVLAGEVSSAVSHSPAVMATALIVGAILIVVPLAVFAFAPDEYAEHVTDLGRRVSRLVGEPDRDGTNSI